MGPNMLRPMIVAPTFLFHPPAMSSSIPVSPPSIPCIARKLRVANAHPCRSIPRSPSGFSRLCRGPATYPSSDIVMLSLSFAMCASCRS